METVVITITCILYDFQLAKEQSEERKKILAVVPALEAIVHLEKKLHGKKAYADFKVKKYKHTQPQQRKFFIFIFQDKSHKNVLK